MKFVKRMFCVAFLLTVCEAMDRYLRGQPGHFCTTAAENGGNSVFARLLLSPQVSNHIHDLLPTIYPRIGTRFQGTLVGFA